MNSKKSKDTRPGVMLRLTETGREKLGVVREHMQGLREAEADRIEKTTDIKIPREVSLAEAAEKLAADYIASNELQA